MGWRTLSQGDASLTLGFNIKPPWGFPIASIDYVTNVLLSQ